MIRELLPLAVAAVGGWLFGSHILTGWTIGALETFDAARAFAITLLSGSGAIVAVLVVFLFVLLVKSYTK